jgi:hypothetical protein
MAIWRMRFTCWITMAIDIHLEYVIVIAFPLQSWLLEPAAVLHYTYIACFLISCCHLPAFHPLILRLLRESFTWFRLYEPNTWQMCSRRDSSMFPCVHMLSTNQVA